MLGNCILVKPTQTAWRSHCQVAKDSNARALSIPASATIQSFASTPSQSGFSEIQPFVDLNQIAFGVLGVAALGTVGYGLYAKNNNSKNRRRISYDSYQTTYPQKRSAENSNDLDQLWLKIGQQIIKGKTMIFNYLEIRKCLSLLCLLV